MLTLQNTEAIRRIEEAIGYTFNDKRLLIQVLTRKTYLKIDPEAPDNEVLEFYGDTLMNYHVTNYFMSKYAHMLDDGLFFMRTVEQFTDMRSHYVCNRYLTDRIKSMGLARYLRAQNRDSELRRDGEKAYADIFESLVGAIYLDSYQNDTLIRAFILRQLGIEPKRLPADIEAFDYDSLTAPAFAESAPAVLEEPETIADLPAEKEEDLQAAPLEMPPAEMSPTETVPVWAELVPASEEETPVEAQADAAPVAETADKEIPTEETALTEAPAPLPVPIPEAPVTAVTVIRTKQDELADFCRRWGYDQPTYGQTPPNAPNARPVAACTMKYKDAKGKLVKISLNDSGKTLAEATEKAAAKMLKKLETQVADKKKKAADQPVEASPAEDAAEKTELGVEKAEAVIPQMPAPEVPAVEAVAAEETVDTVEPVETAEPTAEVTPATETPAEEMSVAEFPAEDAPAAEPAEVVLVEAETSALETAAASETVSAVEEAPVAEFTPDAEKAPIAELAPVEEFIQQTMVLNVESDRDGAPATEDAKPAKAPRKKKTEAADGSDKPAKKTPSKRKTAPKEAKPAEEPPVTETPTAETAESAEKISEAPAKEAKPRKRTPRAKKQETVSEVSAEDGQGQTE